MVCEGILEIRFILLEDFSSLPVSLIKRFNCCQEGDVIKSFDRVCEVQSDKANVEITSRYAGTVRIIHHQEGSIVKVESCIHVLNDILRERERERESKIFLHSIFYDQHLVDR